MTVSTSRSPSIRCRISTACPSGNRSRSGASTIQACRASSKRNFAWGAKRRTEAPSIWRRDSRPCPSSRHPTRVKGPRRNETRLDIREVKRVELCPEHVAFKAQGVEDQRLLFRSIGVLLDIAEGEGDVGRRLGQSRGEV